MPHPFECLLDIEKDCGTVFLFERAENTVDHSVLWRTELSSQAEFMLWLQDHKYLSTFPAGRKVLNAKDGVAVYTTK
ncbi:hypothetical protein AWZ03_014870 [Drosophila navojoa]|uniref:Uncharacterized protein n=1 Tax=Drosophila navojoa TaxID=7232 RepID=A0A484AQP0_DRONA|nr:hypothetical protein AWZ03_014870 [Drosophila navojoa]